MNNQRIYRRMDESAEAFAGRAEQEGVCGLCGVNHRYGAKCTHEMAAQESNRATRVYAEVYDAGSIMNTVTVIERALREAEERGRVEMREKCAQIAHERAVFCEQRSTQEGLLLQEQACAGEARIIAMNIRALPTSSEDQQAAG